MSIPTKTEWDALRSRVEAAEAALNRMRAQAEAAGAELYANRMQWRDTLDMLETLWSERDAQREAAHRQEMDALRSELIGWRERAKEAEAERDRLHAIVADLVAEHDFGAPANVPVSPEAWRQARAALSGGGKPAERKVGEKDD